MVFKCFEFQPKGTPSLDNHLTELSQGGLGVALPSRFGLETCNWSAALELVDRDCRWSSRDFDFKKLNPDYHKYETDVRVRAARADAAWAKLVAQADFQAYARGEATLEQWLSSQHRQLMCLLL